MNALLALIFGPFLQSKGLMKVEGDRPEFMSPAAHVQSMDEAEEPRCRAGTRARAINYGLHGPSRARFV
jgi:hypothetical protein